MIYLISCLLTQKSPDINVFFNRPAGVWRGGFVKVTASNKIVVARFDRGHRELVTIKIADVPSLALSKKQIAELNMDLKADIDKFILVIVPQPQGTNRVAYKLKTSLSGSTKPTHSVHEVSTFLRQRLHLK